MKHFSTIASFLDNAVNLISSIVGDAIAIGGLVTGSLAGVGFRCTSFNSTIMD